MLEQKQHIETNNGSEKSFGSVFAGVFFLIALYPLVDGGNPHLWAVGVAVSFLITAYIAPFLLILPNKLWLKLGLVLGAVVGPVVMMLVYFITVVPVGLIMRLMGKDLLRLKLNAEAKTYWVEREQPVGSMEDQF